MITTDMEHTKKTLHKLDWKLLGKQIKIKDRCFDAKNLNSNWLCKCRIFKVKESRGKVKFTHFMARVINTEYPWSMGLVNFGQLREMSGYFLKKREKEREGAIKFRKKAIVKICKIENNKIEIS